MPPAALTSSALPIGAAQAAALQGAAQAAALQGGPFPADALQSLQASKYFLCIHVRTLYIYITLLTVLLFFSKILLKFVLFNYY